MAEKVLDQQAADKEILKVLQFKVWYLREKGLNELCVYHKDSEKSRLISDLIAKSTYNGVVRKTPVMTVPVVSSESSVGKTPTIVIRESNNAETGTVKVSGVPSIDNNIVEREVVQREEVLSVMVDQLEENRQQSPMKSRRARKPV